MIFHADRSRAVQLANQPNASEETYGDEYAQTLLLSSFMTTLTHRRITDNEENINAEFDAKNSFALQGISYRANRNIIEL